ncbi:MAG TPA: glycosyltransferase family 4 protein [Candidatus Acidoferrum sp.]
MQAQRKFRLAYVVSHPIQYQAPLLRRLAQEPDIELKVFFCADYSAKGYEDEGFGGIHVKWDVPLLEGYEYEFLPALRRSTKASFAAPINRGFCQAFKKEKFDAIWLHGYWNVNSMVAMAAAKLLGIPVMERAEGTLIDHPRSRFRLEMKRAYFAIMRHFIAAVLPISSRNREYWEHYLGAEFPSFMVPYAVDNAYFQKTAAMASDSREEFRAQLGLERDRQVILYASKLMERKRCIDLIEAYIGMKPGANGKKPYLLIVGDGSERARCEARVLESAETGVRFLGFQNQSKLAQYFDLGDVFVLPSVHEPFGLIVNEVMNAGKAIVVSDEVGSQPDLITDGVNGAVFRAGDILALRAALEDILENTEMRREMGFRSLLRINQWSFEEDVRGLRAALHHVAGLPLSTPKPNAAATGGESAKAVTRGQSASALEPATSP